MPAHPEAQNSEYVLIESWTQWTFVDEICYCCSSELASFHLSVPLYLSICLSIYLSIHPSVYLAISLSICPSISLFIFLSSYQSIHIFICLSLHHSPSIQNAYLQSISVFIQVFFISFDYFIVLLYQVFTIAYGQLYCLTQIEQIQCN